MQREKSASLSETDYAEMQKNKAAAEAKAQKEKTPATNGSLDSTATAPTPPSQQVTAAGATETTTTQHAAGGRPRNAPTRQSANDFRFGKMIGEGSFSTVFLAKNIHTNRECASEWLLS